MRAFLTTMLFLALGSSAAYAQAEGGRKYCSYNGASYSLGAILCAAKRHMIICKEGNNKELSENSDAVYTYWKEYTADACDENPSLTPQPPDD